MQDITIAEGEVARTMGQVAKLVTNLQGGGMCAWVPEDERKTTTKHITENGVYNPADDEVYGYSKVTVRVPQGVSGTAHGVTGGFDVDDGEEYFIENVDGNLVFTEIPASIAVTTPPTKTDYTEGNTIDFSGIVVTAYHADGSVFDTEDYPDGVIPFGELVFPVTIAISKSIGVITVEATLEGGLLTYPVRLEQLATLTENSVTDYFYPSEDAYMVINAINNQGIKGSVVAKTNKGVVVLSKEPPNRGATGSYLCIANLGYVHDGKAVYYGTGYYTSYGFSYDDFSPSSGVGDINGIDAWNIMYGNTSGGGRETVPVQWHRFGDDQVLESSFPINVTAFEGWGDNTGDGGSTSGGGDF